MNLLQETKTICQQYGIMPTRSKGQNFLINQGVYEKIIKASDLSKNNNVLEVGPGLGLLTRLLVKNAGKVFAVELDEQIYNYLKIIKEVESLDNLGLIRGNVLDLETGKVFGDKPYKIVANLPYNITSIFLRRFLSAPLKPTEMVLMLQKEVAERIVAKAGEMSILALSVQFYAEAEIVDYVNKEDFWPQPEVDSAIIKIVIKDNKKLLPVSEKDFFRLVKIGFSAKRKKLANNLANGLHKKPAEIVAVLEKIGISPNARAQELSLENWFELVKVL